jgi:hypothetical protein
MELAYYPKNATYQVVKNYDLTIFIKNSIRSYTWKMEFPNSNQAGYFFTLGMVRNNENHLTRIVGHFPSEYYPSEFRISTGIRRRIKL